MKRKKKKTRTPTPQTHASVIYFWFQMNVRKMKVVVEKLLCHLLAFTSDEFQNIFLALICCIVNRESQTLSL